MRAFAAFFKKELTEQLRTSKLAVLFILFVLFGIMNPAVAKMTPWLLEMFAESLSESGITISPTEVSALDSWVQFYKNIPMALIAFVLIESGIFTKEYSSGTLVLSLTKGVPRAVVVLSKIASLVSVFSIGYFSTFAITYAYNAYFWDNSIARSLLFSVFCYWLFGIFTIALLTLFSVLLRSNSGVLLGVGAAVFIAYLIGFIPKIKQALPLMLADGTSLIYGVRDASEYVVAVITTAVLSMAFFLVSIPIFNKKQL